jgi:hypothetical protein
VKAVLERRVFSAAYRVATSEGDTQFRALNRLQAIAGKEIAWKVWLSTKPDPEFVQKVMDRQCRELMRVHTSLFKAVPAKRVEIPVKVYPRLEM